ncbi:hypothetical protein [Dyadobacter crusticola]|uniref:hypothetical protein n=1 Tax=Dyadobacter crusticola TaxID=292407 RepID=UPI0004E1BCD7|nr:hypothetical protein [Dyadobacter crusticola]
MRKLQVIAIFYRSIWPVTTATSLLMWGIVDFPSFTAEVFPTFIMIFLWLRSGCQALIWYLFRSSNRKGFVFYNHFGLSEMRLALLTYLLDLAVFALWIILKTIILG